MFPNLAPPCKVDCMSDFIPKAPTGVVKGLGPKAQKLQALKEKAARAKEGKNFAKSEGAGTKASSSGFKKTSFQRKAT